MNLSVLSDFKKMIGQNDCVLFKIKSIQVIFQGSIIFCIDELLVGLIHRLVRYHECPHVPAHISTEFSFASYLQSFDRECENHVHFLPLRRCSIASFSSSMFVSIPLPIE